MIKANPEIATPVKLFMPTAVWGGYTELQVLQSAAGFYIGTRYEEKDAEGEVVWEEPGSRDSDYFTSFAAAEQSLKLLTSLGDDISAQMLRSHP